MSPKQFNLLEDAQKEIIVSVYSAHILSIGNLCAEYSIFMPNAEFVYEKAKNSPHFAVDYLHSIVNDLLQRKMAQSYRVMLMSLIESLSSAGCKNVALVFKRALDILQADFSAELFLPIDEITEKQEMVLDKDEEESLVPSGIMQLDDGQTEIEEFAFSNKDDISVLVIPASVSNIHHRAFVNFYGTFQVNIGNVMYSSSDGILYNKDKSKLLRVPIKVGFDAYSTATAVKVIGKYAFQGSLHLTFIDVSDNVERIEDFAFCENNDLEELHIAGKVIYIGHHILAGCANLRIIYCELVNLDSLTIEDDAFDGFDLSKVTLIVRPSEVEEFRRHPIWGKFTNTQANNNILEDIPKAEVSSVFPPIHAHYGGCGGWGTFHGYQSVSGHWRSGHWRNGSWVSGHYVRSHGRWR